MENISTKTLYIHLQNALHTGATCTGHTKAHLNYVKANEYRDELNRRGENLPTYDLERLFVEDNGWRESQTNLGEFNGEGAC
tara:strand:+ start:195 stop:440 length:246 start_codon:yes stop_codon:yes gene_type:complete